eukprot:363603-Chlamydomonas_euryale.AAC.9
MVQNPEVRVACAAAVMCRSMSVKFQRNAGGMQVERRWNAGGMQVECKWNAGGMQVECRWNADSSACETPSHTRIIYPIQNAAASIPVLYPGRFWLVF